MRRRWIVILAATAGAAAMSGCYIQGQEAGELGGEAQAAGGFDSGRPTEGDMYISGMPIVKEKLELKAVVKKFANHGDFNKMEALKKLEARTNIALKWEQIPGEVFNEKKHYLFTSGQLPDLFFAGLGSIDVVQYGSQGLLIPLERLIDQYAPNIRSVFSAYPELKKAVTAPDGHIYSLPFLEANDYMQYRNHLMINKVWLDKLGLKVPETTDEFHEVLRQFKNSDPNGNGKPDEIPFASMFTQVSNNYRALFNSFGVLNPDGNRMAVIGGQVRFEPVQPEYKEAVKYIRSLYTEGLMDEEAFTQDLKQYMAKGGAKEVLYGAFTAFLGDIELGSMDRLTREYVAVPPLKGPGGAQSWRRQDNRIVPNMFSITSSNKHPEATMRLIDAMNEETTAFELWKGPVGSHLSRTADGKIVQNPLPADESNLGVWIGKAAPLNYVPLLLTEEMLGSFVPDEASKLRNRTYELYKPYIVKDELTYPQMIYYTTEQTNRLKVLDADITSYLNKMESRWIVEGGIDQEWESYLAELKMMGLDEKIEIHQQVYDAVYKSP
ncbi:extracellular solute-binding protein [Paenibacillus oceani]|uniref:Extracellular solute-binding protein n=1 Tax=Paenibacillus oceani TaxID=2772510 RepID=A0A927C663_9BACL|nr:extracellular solute-binding protein [Paenibacillus oceani]MBD2861564.1 extracellular solute-binding protein [Paenibacillus oceani]